MARLIIPALVALVVSGPAWGQGYSEELTCKVFKELSGDINKEGPTWVDTITRSDGIAVFCSRKFVDYKKFIKLLPSQLRVGWEERKQKQWNALYCKSSSRIAVNNGWTIQQTTTFIDGFQHRMIAVCNSGS